jgi:hypothetical protein
MIKRFPLAVASVLVGLVSFINFFGLEKAVLAVVLGALALKYRLPGEEKGRTCAAAGIALGSVYILILLGILIVKGPQIVAAMGRLR